MRRSLLAGFVLACVAATFALEAQQNPDEFRWTGQIARGKSVEIKGVSGGIRATATTGNQVEVLAHKRARRSNTADVFIDVVNHDGNVTICAVYPPSAHSTASPTTPGNGYTSRNWRPSSPNATSSGPNECKPGSEGRMNVNNNDVNVEFEVRLPEGVRLIATTVNGAIDASSLKSDVEANTVNGRILVSTSGVASADTVNGSIDVSLGAAKWDQPLDFHTVNGGITLTLPKAASADLHADTLNGEIDSDFPVSITSSRHRGRRITGSIGTGGKELHLSTTNGGIRLRANP